MSTQEIVPVDTQPRGYVMRDIPDAYAEVNLTKFDINADLLTGKRVKQIKALFRDFFKERENPGTNTEGKDEIDLGAEIIHIACLWEIEDALKLPYPKLLDAVTAIGDVFQSLGMIPKQSAPSSTATTAAGPSPSQPSPIG